MRTTGKVVADSTLIISRTFHHTVAAVVWRPRSGGEVAEVFATADDTAVVA